MNCGTHLLPSVGSWLGGEGEKWPEMSYIKACVDDEKSFELHRASSWDRRVGPCAGVQCASRTMRPLITWAQWRRHFVGEAVHISKIYSKVYIICILILSYAFTFEFYSFDFKNLEWVYLKEYWEKIYSYHVLCNWHFFTVEILI